LTDKLDEKILASAVRYLLDGNEEDAASVLLACSLESMYIERALDFGDSIDIVAVGINGPRAAYEILSDENHPITQAIHQAITVVMPADYGISRFYAGVEIIDLDPNWRSELLEIARGRGVHNQLAGERLARIWNNLRFRSGSEVKIAAALDRVGVLFLPNCKARLGLAGKRENREPDFLICCDGKWGILEVDGGPFHPPARTVEDHERDRLFKQHGIRIVEHYDSNRCFEHPEEVVQNFLSLLKQA
jgi:hypothetical protein